MAASASTPPALRKLRSAADAVRFSYRLSRSTQGRDERTAKAAADYVARKLDTSEPHGHHPGAPALSFARRRVLEENRSESMEAAGIYESRLGLKQRTRETMLSSHTRRSFKDLADSTPAPFTSPRVASSPLSPTRPSMSPMPPRRSVAGDKPASLRSPVAHERKLEEDSDSDSVDSFTLMREAADSFRLKQIGAGPGVAVTAPRRSSSHYRLGVGVRGSSGSDIFRPPRPDGLRRVSSHHPGSGASGGASGSPTPSVDKIRRVMAAVKFANRVSTETHRKDIAVENAAKRVVESTRTKDHVGAGTSVLLRRSVLGEEDAAKLEAEGVFESRLGLREKRLHHGRPGQVSPTRRSALGRQMLRESLK